MFFSLPNKKKRMASVEGKFFFSLVVFPRQANTEKKMVVNKPNSGDRTGPLLFGGFGVFIDLFCQVTDPPEMIHGFPSVVFVGIVFPFHQILIGSITG